MNDLNTRLLTAHETGDQAALVALYTEAASTAGDEMARGFYLTHAYVFALELGAPEAEALRKTLIAMGREPAS